MTSCAATPVTVPDFLVCGYEGPAGGPNAACSCVHTVSTAIAPVHYGLNQCLELLQGAVFTQGSNFSQMQANIDTLCAQEGNCTYEESQAANALKTVMHQIAKVKPK